jgi:hypothetical protein
VASNQHSQDNVINQIETKMNGSKIIIKKISLNQSVVLMKKSDI